MNDMDTSEGLSLSRRTLLTGAATAAALAVAAPVVQAAAEEHAHHHHPVADEERTALIDSALACIKSSEACNAHCIELFKAGDTSVANCAATVQEALAACAALAKLAAYDSRHLKATAQLCIDICGDCEKECRKHEKKHAACKACADDCAACIKACKAYLA